MTGLRQDLKRAIDEAMVAKFPHHASDWQELMADYFAGKAFIAVAAALEAGAAGLFAAAPLIRAQAFTEAADAIQTTRTGGGWENNINIGLHKAELLVRGLGEGTANR